MRKIAILFLISLPGLSNLSWAEGKLSSLSAAGSLKVSVQKAESVRVKGLNSELISINNTNSSEINLCILSTNQQYNLSLISNNGPDNSFQLFNGSEYIEYKVSLSNESPDTNTDNTNELFSSDFKSTCDKQQEVKLSLDIQPEIGSTNTQAIFTDTLTLMIAPI